MGCSASRPETLLSTNALDSSSTPKSPLPFPRTISLPTHLVHHPPLRKGDTHHLVSLTSTTYGSLLLIDPNPNPKEDPPSPSSEDCPSPDSVINTWELMAGLDELEPAPCFSDDPRCYSLDSANLKTGSVFEKVKYLRNSIQSKSFISDVYEEVEDVPVENSTKPLWQHLSEELILADMDPNVVSSFRKAESSRKLGYKNTRSKLSDVKVSPLFDSKIQLPGTEDKIVIYFTSLRGIRRTYEDCCVVRTIFKGLRVPVDERDISMDSSYRKELQRALDKMTVSLPQVFVRGRHFGGADEVKQLHEDGELAKFVQGFPVQDPGFVCETCGNARFVPCVNCNGSRKVFAEEQGQLRRCTECNENGLVRCPICSS